MEQTKRILRVIAAVWTVAIILFSCRSNLEEAEKLDLSTTPRQTIDSMVLLQTERGKLQVRAYAPTMKRYETDTLSYELFPEGVEVYAYTDDGILETTIRANEARHDTGKGQNKEIWKAYGNVVIKNIVKKETMETDTIYWNRTTKEIYTDCYIRMYSPEGFMQGYGMKSDERARNSIIQRPFNSYTVVVQDSTKVLIDSINFIGPLLPKGVK